MPCLLNLMKIFSLVKRLSCLSESLARATINIVLYRYVKEMRGVHDTAWRSELSVLYYVVNVVANLAFFIFLLYVSYVTFWWPRDVLC